MRFLVPAAFAVLAIVGIATGEPALTEHDRRVERLCQIAVGAAVEPPSLPGSSSSPGHGQVAPAAPTVPPCEWREP